jgi:hypothetical protein
MEIAFQGWKPPPAKIQTITFLMRQAHQTTTDKGRLTHNVILKSQPKLTSTHPFLVSLTNQLR